MKRLLKLARLAVDQCDTGHVYVSTIATDGAEDTFECFDEGTNARAVVLDLVAEINRHKPASGPRDCTCLGSRKGRDGLAPGWRCALDRRER